MFIECFDLFFRGLNILNVSDKYGKNIGGKKMNCKGKVWVNG